MPTWPITLPAAPLIDRFRETAPNTLIRTEMDQGPAKVRQRTTAGVRLLSVSYLLSADQTADLDDFYTNDTAGGALAFDYIHPRTGDTLTCRFKSPPEYAPGNGLYYLTTLTLEVLP